MSGKFTKAENKLYEIIENTFSYETLDLLKLMVENGVGNLQKYNNMVNIGLNMGSINNNAGNHYLVNPKEVESIKKPNIHKLVSSAIVEVASKAINLKSSAETKSSAQMFSVDKKAIDHTGIRGKPTTDFRVDRFEQGHINDSKKL